MKVKDFIKERITIDVCDTYDERCYIAFVGPAALTEQGQDYFRNALNLDIHLPATLHDYTAIVDASTADQAEEAKNLFYCLAGFIDDERYERFVKRR